MTSFDIASLLLPVTDDAPAGDDLEYDPEFLELERTAAPKAEKVIGDSVKAAEEPDWDKVQSLALGLMNRSRDLRIAIHLTNAWTRSRGVTGWSDGLALIRGMLENLWDSVHPQLDSEDDDDPTMRVNSVVPLGDMQASLGHFRNTPFVQSPRLGRFSLRDLRLANGTLKTADGGTPEAGMSDIEACCMDCAEDELVSTARAVSEAFDHAKAIDGIFTDRVGTAGPDLKNLLSEIHELKKFLDPQVARRLPGEGAGDADQAGEADDAGAGAGATVRSVPGAISGPQDVSRRIDELCEYYARNEPSSPVPLLLRRAQQLIGMGFEDLLKNLAPGGIQELRVVSGVSDEE